VYEQNARIFKAFCDESRLRILERLQHGDLCACVLMEQLGIKQPALSYHMKILVESGVVESTQVGKWTHYHLSESGSENALALLRSLTKSNRAAEAKAVCCNEYCVSAERD
jgi:ArsR family transcriptional regulator, arsenate/arsenite/antimonite-responsive transcriptional repressor